MTLMPGDYNSTCRPAEQVEDAAPLSVVDEQELRSLERTS
jgi:hypothetical protein